MYDDNYVRFKKGIPLVAFCSYFDFENNLYKNNYSKFEKDKMIFSHTHCHSDFEIIHINDGCGYMTVNGNEKKVKKGDTVFINPYEMHYGYAEYTQKVFSYICIDFDINFLLDSYSYSSFVSFIENGEKKVTNYIDNKKYKKYIKNILSSYENAFKGWEMSAKASLYDIFSNLQKDEDIKNISSLGNDFIKKACIYIEKNYPNDVTSLDASVYFGYNHNYFCRKFKKEFSMSFGEYLNITRIKKAVSKFENGENNISKTAFECGFKNTSYFAKVFKNSMGLTCTKYKKQLKKR